MAAQPDIIAAYPYSPYCGAPATPDDFWSRWNLDPALLTALALGVALYFAIDRHASPARRAAFLTGWVVGSLARVSPLCALSVSLFSARVGQHMILTSLVAPLVALGIGRRPAPTGRGPVLAATAFAVALWLWHSPAPYLGTFTS